MGNFAGITIFLKRRQVLVRERELWYLSSIASCLLPCPRALHHAVLSRISFQMYSLHLSVIRYHLLCSCSLLKFSRSLTYPWFFSLFPEGNTLLFRDDRYPCEALRATLLTNECICCTSFFFLFITFLFLNFCGNEASAASSPGRSKTNARSQKHS